MTRAGDVLPPHRGRFEQLPGDDRLRQADDQLSAIERRRAGPLAIDALDGIANALKATESSRLASWLQQRVRSAASVYLAIRLLPLADASASADRWEQLLGLVSVPDPFLLLDAVRAHLAAGRTAEAAARMRTALGLRPPYLFHARAAALLAELWTSHPPVLREARIAILGATTTSLLMPVLRALCFRDGVAAHFYEGLYGAFRQEILDPASALYRFRPTVTFIATHWRALSLPAVSPDEDAAVEEVISEYETLWRTLAEATGSHIVQHAFDFPRDESHDYVAVARPGGRTRVIARVNLELARRAPAFVSVLDQAGIQREVGGRTWHDERLWHVAQQHPAPEALPALAELQMAHVRAVTGLARKVVVCDLDNTLWGGVVGEDGLDGIRIGPGSAAGEAYARLQEYLLELKERGVLLAVCSKNNPEDARLPFERHPQMRLRTGDFAAFVANWTDKARNLRAIAQQLSLGTDSFVFLDDNPIERAWIRAQLPEVAVVDLGPTPFSYVADLDAARHFFALAITDDDWRRSQRYHSEAARQGLRARFDSLDEFLTDLQMHSVVAPISAENLTRVAQLVNKTNQFNLTGRRLQANEIQALLEEPRSFGAAFTLSDRFGDHGLISVLLCRSPEPSCWEIHAWVMSCRVLGRGMERFVAERMVEAARAAGIDRVVGTYRPTGRNELVRNLLQELGFTRVATSPDEERYEYGVNDPRPFPSHAIRERDRITELSAS